MNIISRLVAIASILGALSACGGGGGASPMAASHPTAVIQATGGVTVSASGSDIQGSVGTAIKLSASASTDSNSTIKTYQWTIKTQPSGSSATISTPTSAAATLVPDVAGTYTIQLAITDAQGVSSTQSATITATVSIPLTSVVASVVFNGQATTKPTQEISIGTVVSFDASGSMDPDGDPVAVSWLMSTRPAGSAAAIVSSGTAAHFTADVLGEYDVRVRATDPAGTFSDVTYVFNANPSPTAIVVSSVNGTGGASATLQAATGYLVLLDSSASTAAAGDAVANTWTLLSKPTGSGTQLSALSGARVSFIPDVAGDYIVTLVMADSTTGTSSTFTTTIHVIQGPTAVVSGSGAPVAEPSAPAFASSTGVPVVLRGTGSYAVGGGALTYAWTMVSVPAGSAATITAPAAQTTSFTPDYAGAYVVQLTVTDTFGNSAKQSVTVNVGSYAPVVVVNQPQLSILLGGTVAPSASLSFDPIGNSLTYLWTIDSRPAGSTAALIGSVTSASSSFKPDVAGTYTATVTVSNGTLSSVGHVTVVAFSASGHTVPLGYAPLLMRYNKAAGKLVLIAANPNMLHIVNPAAATDFNVALPNTVKDLAISPNGSLAAVLHEGVVSVVDLAAGTLLHSWPTAGSQTSVQISNAGLIYLSGQTGGQWVTPGMTVISASTGSTVSTLGGFAVFYGNMHGILADAKNQIFTISDGLSPSQIYSVALDPTSGYPLSTAGTPYWGTYPMSAPLWLAGDQSLLFTAAGDYFSTTGLTYVGTFGLSTPVSSMSHSATAQEAVVFAMSGPAYSSNVVYPSSYQRFTGALLFPAAAVPLPLVGGMQSYGIEIYHTANDAHVIVVQTGTSTPNGTGAQYFVLSL